MTLAVQTNCVSCMQGKHENCSKEDCLCKNNKHGESLRYGVKVEFEKTFAENFYDEVKEINEEISKEPKAHKNDDWALVASEIQSSDYFLTIRESKDMWYYSKKDGIYKPYADTIIAEHCQRMIKECTEKSVREIIKTIQRNETMIDGKDLFESRHINTQSGILDPKTFQEFNHSPEYYTISKLPFSINHKARNLKLWNHILSIIDPKDINLFMELLWICISWKNPFKKQFVFIGPPNTQKTTLSDILVWIIGNENVSREKPSQFLGTNRFSTSKFIGKRINIASEIGNLTESMIENQKSLVGAELQNTERKSDNAERYFDPTQFVFLFTTNTLGPIYSRLNDNSLITRYQFMNFRNQIEDSKANGLWFDKFFKNNEDKQSSIDTIINITINYKKGQMLNRIPKTRWSTIAETKRILREEMPLEDKYFEAERIIQRDGSKLYLEEIKKAFELFVGYKIDNHKLGFILKRHGMKSHRSNNKTYYKGYAFNIEQPQKTLS